MRIIPLILTAALAGPVLAQDGQPTPPFWEQEWPDTNFQRASVPFVEILSGGPPKDGIPAIDAPQFLNIADETELPEDEPVITLDIEGERARAYPIRYLTWHEIVNDRIGGKPVSVTFCPLCNSAVVFDGMLDGREMTFGVSGKLRNSDMVMYDRQTESWWQQFLGEAIVGELTGAQLTVIPSWMESWASFKEQYPDGIVMARPGAFGRSYGVNPYAGYDSLPRPFLYSGEPPPHGIEPLSRVVSVGARAWPLERIAQGPVTEAGVTITWRAGMASALDQRSISGSRDIGMIRVRDAEGQDVAHDVGFAFAFHAFHPDGVWMLGE
ncbi:hypothetical protein FHS89_000835 [Rubricella aquisinus]|uniref:DUF3179 domain-containing protein n=1 Tax=Rubricella aquisinus TaxID=2028108 RepID=A0A840WI85_9RHOB|nr:DUF3179 domain-containing protein [Rubricella aquisinus]MBB5514829.1 hypothetical protein [Rubricella aquisinus]